MDKRYGIITKLQLPNKSLTEQFLIYPNPTIDKINFLGSFKKNAEYLVSDITGNVLMNGTTSDFSNLSTEILKSGVYTVTIISENNVYTTRFIKL